MRVWEIVCQRCGHVTMRYYGDKPVGDDTREDIVSHLRYLDGSDVSSDDAAKCSECNEDHLPETFLPRNWHEYKDFDPAPKRKGTHGHPGDSPFKKT